MTMRLEVFSGTDTVLLDQAVRAAVKVALGDDSPDFALAELSEPDYQLDDGWSIAPVIDAAQTPPMFSDTRVVVGHHLARFSTGDTVQALVTYLDNPLDSTHLILVWDRGPALNRRTSGLPKALTEKLKSLGVGVVKTDVGTKDAGAFIDTQLRDLGLKLDGQARRMLGEHLGGDVNRLVGIGKSLLATHGAGATLSVGDVEPYIGGAGDVPPWDLTDAMANGDVPGALAMCRRMIHGGERHPLAILATLSTHYGRMASLDGAAVGNDRDAASFLGVKGSTYPVKKAMQQARAMGPDRVRRAWGMIAQADIDLRGGTGADAQLVLEVLVARLSSLSRRR